MIVEYNDLLQRYQCIKAPKNVYHQSICIMGINFLAQVIKVNAWALRSLGYLGGVGSLQFLMHYLFLCIFPKSYTDCQPYFLNQYIRLHRNGNQKKRCFDVLAFFNLRFLCSCKYYMYNFESCFIHLIISYEYFALLNTATKTF